MKNSLGLDIPGVDKEHLKVDLREDILAVSGERKDFQHRDGEEAKTYASFSQNFTLPQDSNISEIDVSQNNGVLNIVIPKVKKEEISRTLEIKSGTSNLLK